MQHARNLLFSITMIFLLALECFATTKPQPLQTQIGPEGIEVDLVRCKVTGSVLSVAFLLRHPGEGKGWIALATEDIYYVAGDEKYPVLKDNQGKWLAGPGEYFKEYITSDKPQVIWYKFSEPPDNGAKIQIGLKGVVPFDDIEVQR